MKKRIVYIAHPIFGDVKGNLEDIIRILKQINVEYPDVIAMVPYFTDCMVLDDRHLPDRIKGLNNCKQIIETGIFDELWLTGQRVSVGMNMELTAFREQNKPIINLIGKI